jgi:hypothetical protein
MISFIILSISVFLSRLASRITSCICCPNSSSGGLIVDPLGAQGLPIRCITVVVPFHSSCHHLASLVIVQFPLSRLISLITSCICGPSSSPGGIIVDPLGPKGSPTVHHCRGSFSFILSSSCISCHRLISLITSNFSYHVLHLWPQ